MLKSLFTGIKQYKLGKRIPTAIVWCECVMHRLPTKENTYILISKFLEKEMEISI